MKKIVKMSLVAAVAVAGLTTANAKPLEEAIKNVDVSGTVVYRHQDYNPDKGDGGSSVNNYKIALNLSSKVNDDVKVYTRFIAGGRDNGFQSFNNTTGSDGRIDVSLSHVYFGYTGIKNTTVNIGKQGLTTPWTTAIDSDGNEQTGTGVLAISTQGPVTVVAAYFNQTNVDVSGNVAGLTGAENLATVGILGKIGPVALDAWYLDMADVFDSYSIGAKASFKVGSVKLGADVRYASLEGDSNNVAGISDDNTFLKVALSAKAGIYNALWVYVKTGEDGGTTALDGSSANQVDFWAVNTLNHADADFHHVRLGVQALDTLHISANFTTMDYNNVKNTPTDNEEQVYAQFIYKMSKNLSTYIRYGTFERDEDDLLGGNRDADDKYRGRLQIQYTF